MTLKISLRRPRCRRQSRVSTFILKLHIGHANFCLSEFNPFARKAAPDTNKNPFARGLESSKSLHKSDSFFDKVDAAEHPSSLSKKRPAAGKGKEKDGKKDAGVPVQRQATLFNMMGPKKDATKKAKGTTDDVSMSDASSMVESQPETLAEDDWEETQPAEEETLESTCS